MQLITEGLAVKEYSRWISASVLLCSNATTEHMMGEASAWLCSGDSFQLKLRMKSPILKNICAKKRVIWNSLSSVFLLQQNEFFFPFHKSFSTLQAFANAVTCDTLPS